MLPPVNGFCSMLSDFTDTPAVRSRGLGQPGPLVTHYCSTLSVQRILAAGSPLPNHTSAAPLLYKSPLIPASAILQIHHRLFKPPGWSCQPLWNHSPASVFHVNPIHLLNLPSPHIGPTQRPNASFPRGRESSICRDQQSLSPTSARG